ncbi:MAG: hypothetical protein JNK23_00280 [Opitutaceae bacterium]|nr:hypothetical protein [Opitutaceae bacterium]
MGVQQSPDLLPWRPDNTNLGPHTWPPRAYGVEGHEVWAHGQVRTGHSTLGELFPAGRVGEVHDSACSKAHHLPRTGLNGEHDRRDPPPRRGARR